MSYFLQPARSVSPPIHIFPPQQHVFNNWYGGFAWSPEDDPRDFGNIFDLLSSATIKRFSLDQHFDSWKIISKSNSWISVYKKTADIYSHQRKKLFSFGNCINSPLAAPSCQHVYFTHRSNNNKQITMELDEDIYAP